eukprot:scaffold10504_cov124-Isochrysis_galbana.AAC.3
MNKIRAFGMSSDLINTNSSRRKAEEVELARAEMLALGGYGYVWGFRICVILVTREHQFASFSSLVTRVHHRCTGARRARAPARGVRSSLCPHLPAPASSSITDMFHKAPPAQCIRLERGVRCGGLD